MKVDIAEGKYVLAVSGGVDSMSLLHTLSGRPGVELVVAHFNHGIRPDASFDERLVKEVAAGYGHQVVVGYGRLGAAASEEQARKARYAFLNHVKQESGAQALITAHHRDDWLETALLNTLRGTGRRGLSSIANSTVSRPLLGVSKSEIIEYARQNGLKWREDSTNNSDRYLRNQLREKTLGLERVRKKQMLIRLEKVAKINKKLDEEVATLSQKVSSKGVINRSQFINLPSGIADELVAFWLNQCGVGDYSKATVGRLSLALKTARPHTRHAVMGKWRLEINQKTAHFSNR